MNEFLKKKAAAFFVVLSVIVLIPLFAFFEESFADHMVLHLVLTFALAPALVATQFFLWVIPISTRAKLRQRFRALLNGYSAFSTPIVAFSLSASFLWFAHVPAIFNATLTNDAFHGFIHFGLLVTAVFFWQPMIRTDGGVPYLSTNESKILYVLAASIQSAVLGSLIAFSSNILFTGYLATNSQSVVLADQQLGGTVMLVAGALAYIVALVLSLKET